jgi:dTDP-4-amino-4,6-dideoxygalactose transaminase
MHTLDTTVSIPLVDLKAQYYSIKQEIDAVIAAVLEETAFIGGSYVKTFEEQFARFCGAQHCIGVANGTDALFIALKVLGVGPGDEVITAANTFVATSEAIKMAGAQVVFVDIDPRTYLIDVSLIEDKITPRTRAIIPVHLYGQPADMQAIRDIAGRHGLAVVSDAAQAHGALDKGAPIATLADVTCFSFYPGKNLGAYGDGGALVTDDDEVALRARMFANHGRTKKYDHELEGVNSRLDGLQAAILGVKLGHLDRWTRARRRVAYAYNEALQGLRLVTPAERPDVYAVYHLYVVRVESEQRAFVQHQLAAAGISTGVHYPVALPALKAYGHLGHSEADFPMANQASKEILSLPMFPELSEDRVRSICETIREIC